MVRALGAFQNIGLKKVEAVAEEGVREVVAAGGVAVSDTEVALSAAPMSGAEERGQERAPEWRFRLGQCISHRDQSMPSLVLSRFKTAKGREIYGVRSFAQVDPQRDRIILGDCLVDVVPGSAPCQDCLLFNTGMCPGQIAAAAATAALEAAA